MTRYDNMVEKYKKDILLAKEEYEGYSREST